MNAPRYAAVNHQEVTQDNGRATLLDLVLAHKLDYTRSFLRERRLHFTGTTAVLRERLTLYLNTEVIHADELIDLLNNIEGWGNQHVYLFSSPDGLLDSWTNEQWVSRHLQDAGLTHLLNRRLPLILPEAPTLSSIQYSREHVRFFWVERRVWEERRPEEDEQEDDIIRKAYKIRCERGITSFAWDLVSGQAMLMIQRLPRGSNYTSKLEEYKSHMRSVIDIDSFQPFEIRRAVQSIEQSGEVRSRQVNWETARGGFATLKSSGRNISYHVDPQLHDARQALGTYVSGALGNFYWLPNEHLASEVHTHIYSRDNRVGIFGEHTEKEVRHVLSRIRHHSR